MHLRPHRAIDGSNADYGRRTAGQEGSGLREPNALPPARPEGPGRDLDPPGYEIVLRSRPRSQGGDPDHLCHSPNTDPIPYVSAMRFDRTDADAKTVGDLLIQMTGRNRFDNLSLARAEPAHQFSG